MKKPSYSDMDPADIRILLMRAGVTQAEIAHKLNVNPSMITRVIDGLSVSDRVRRAIAAACGTDIRRIWPSAYLKGAAPKPGRPRVCKECISC